MKKDKNRKVRQIYLPGIADTAQMVLESIEYLKIHEPEEGYFVGFSGGKDSIVALELCRIAGVKHEAFYSCTRIDPPEVVRFIKKHYPDVTFLMPKMTFWEGIKKKSPPLRMLRWCCDVLKKEPGQEHPLKVRVMGIRAEESTRRASRPRESTFKKQTTIKPIFWWKEYHIWDFIESHNLPYPALYDEGFHRIGCVVCPYILGTSPGAVRQRLMSMERWPGMWKAFKNASEEWFSIREQKSPEGRRNGKSDTFEEYWEEYLRGFE